MGAAVSVAVAVAVALADAVDLTSGSAELESSVLFGGHPKANTATAPSKPQLIADLFEKTDEPLIGRTFLWRT